MVEEARQGWIEITILTRVVSSSSSYYNTAIDEEAKQGLRRIALLLQHGLDEDGAEGQGGKYLDQVSDLILAPLPPLFMDDISLNTTTEMLGQPHHEVVTKHEQKRLQDLNQSPVVMMLITLEGAPMLPWYLLPLLTILHASFFTIGSHDLVFPE